MNNRISPISIAEVKFCSFDFKEKENANFVEQLTFDRRHDFLVEADFCGIAAEIIVSRDIYSMGVRRRVSFTLIDMTSRCEVASRHIIVSINKHESLKSYRIYFPADSVEFKAGHTYKLIVNDMTASVTLGESVIHLFGNEEVIPPKWYTVNSGGVTSSWSDRMYKVLRTEDSHKYYAKFELSQNFGAITPDILPELEIRLYYPDGKRVDVRFMEPRCYDYDTNRYNVECSFMAGEDTNGVFYAELLCMQYVLAGFVFDTAGESEAGEWCGEEIYPLNEYSPEASVCRLRNRLAIIAMDPDDELGKAIEDFIQSELNNLDSNDVASESDSFDEKPPLAIEQLTGLKAVKEKLAIYERLVTFNKMRHDSGLPTPDTPLHAMFLGSPGTGKTTVAKLMGQMLQRAGVLSSGHVVVRERATLLGQYYSSEGENTLKALEEARGGILFIDEAYQLYQPNDPKDPGKFVIETLLTALADDSNRDWMLILAGYPEEMKRMFEMNPGLKSRIPDSNIYNFEDFTSTELMEIAEDYLSSYRFGLSDDARKALAHRLDADYLFRDRGFGNARHVMNMIQTEILPAMAVRVTSLESMDSEQLSVIQASDIPDYNFNKIQPLTQKIGFCA